MHGVSIRKVSPEAFRVLKNLRAVTMDGCHLKTAPPLHVIGKTLEYLSLERNEIRTVSKEYFTSYHVLKIVLLSGNLLEFEKL